MTQFTNQATLSYGTAVTSSNIAVGQLQEVLSATKTAVQTTYGPQDSVTYIVSIINSGTSDFTDITVTDNLGGYTFNDGTVYPLTYTANTMRYYINGVLQETPNSIEAGPPLVVSNLKVPAGGNGILVYEAVTNQFASGAANATIENQAVVSADGITPITTTAKVTAANVPYLSITKSVSPVPVAENGTLTYTFLIQNTGNAEADTAVNAVVKDTFSPVLSDLEVTFDGMPWTQDTEYTYDESSGEFATETGKVTVPAATYQQNKETGAWVVTPGVSTLVVSGTV